MIKYRRQLEMATESIDEIDARGSLSLLSHDGIELLVDFELLHLGEAPTHLAALDVRDST